MNKISVVKHVAWLSVAVLAFVFGQQAKAQTPPSPPFTVMLYYDGSPEFAEAHAEVLAGFAEDPDYWPVNETSDPAVFTAMLSINAHSDCHLFSHPSDVYFAITTDGVLATSWNTLAGLVGFNSNYASMYLEPSDGTISAHMVTQVSIPDADPVPPGDPCFLPWQEDITDEILGNPSAQAASAPETTGIIAGITVNSLAQLGLGSGGGGPFFPDFEQWLEDFREWVQRNIDKARQTAADTLNWLAGLIETLGPETTINVKVEVKAGLPGGVGHVVVTFEFNNIPTSQAAEIAKKIGKQVEPK